MSHAPDTKAPEKRRSLLLLLWPFMRVYRWRLALGVLLITGSVMGEVFSPRLIGSAVDVLRNSEQTRLDPGPELNRYALLIIALAIVAGTCRFFMRTVIIGASRWIEHNLRTAFFAHLQILSSTFYDRERTGDIMERATGDMEAVRMFVGPGLMHATNTLLFAPLAFVFMFNISVSMTLATLVPFVLLASGVKSFGQRIYARSKELQDHTAVVSAMLQENFTGIRVVQAFRQESAQTDQFRELADINMDKAMLFAKVNSAFMPFMMFMASVGFLTVIGLGGYLAMTANPRLLGIAVAPVTPGELTTFTIYLGMLIWPVIALGWTVNLYQRGAASMARIQKVLDTPPFVLEPKFPVRPATLTAHVEVKNLSFKYPMPDSIADDDDDPVVVEAKRKQEKEGRPVANGKSLHQRAWRPGSQSGEEAPAAGEMPYALRDITIDLRPGQTLGVIGPIGSGKSTLARLLGRLYPVPDGAIFHGGHDINTLAFDALRRHVGFVFQETFLFSASIVENIAFGKPGATREDVERVCKIAALHDDIMGFPKGYDTMLGERGINLSGGQKQRAAIARALLYDPKVLVLDDALSAVDTETEERILNGLREANEERTVVIVAHRVSTLRDADHIVVLKRGKMIEQGSHTELLVQNGLYAKLHRMQELERQIALAS